MKYGLPLLLAAALFASCGTQEPEASYPINPVPFTSVQVGQDSFWGQRLKASRETTIPLAFSKCEESGRYDNFVKATAQMASEENLGYYVGGFPFDDTDVYKTIEGASYTLQTYPDEALEAYIDSVLTIVAAAQEPDGYLYTARTMNPEKPHAWSGSERWEEVEGGSHEFYNLGHMIDGAVAHYQATGKRNFLDIAIAYADCICREIGPGEGQLDRVPGHQIAEMALARLYTVTGDRKYLDQAKYFLDRRGYTSRKDSYSQAHEPVAEQDEAVGHAVRAGYMYAGMADVAALTGEQAYIDAIDRIWDNIVSKKFYITGGVGAQGQWEGYDENYVLRNEEAYCETCAAISNVYMNYRMFLLHGESKYFDVLERSLYNGLISGVSLDGGTFFYPNPLASSGQHERQSWFGCACCPSNICRFIPSVPGYVYATDADKIYVNLFMPNEAVLEAAGKSFTLVQETDYPWNGDIAVKVKEGSGRFRMMLRIPGWVRGDVVPSDLYSYVDGKSLAYSCTVNGEAVDCTVGADGYLAIDRKWSAGDEVCLHFDMEPRIVKAHPAVKDDEGLLAVERGPLVYCAEWPDNAFPVALSASSELAAVPAADVHSTGLAGIDVINADGHLTVITGESMTLIPYYAWCHRGPGQMAVWLPAL